MFFNDPKEETNLDCRSSPLQKVKVPSAQALRLYDFKFDDFSLDDDGSLKACLRMFLDLDLIGRFHIDYEVLCRWLLRSARRRTYLFHQSEIYISDLTKSVDADLIES